MLFNMPYKRPAHRTGKEFATAITMTNTMTLRKLDLVLLLELYPLGRKTRIIENNMVNFQLLYHLLKLNSGNTKKKQQQRKC